MLYQVGPATISTFPFSIDAVRRKTGADWAAKDLLGRLRGREFMGEGDETLKLSGTILPFNQQMPGGMLILDILHGLRLAGIPTFVMRGDFIPIGWWVLEDIRESHEYLSPTGIGNVVKHELELTKVSSFGFDAGYSLLGTIINLFDATSAVNTGINNIVSSVGNMTDIGFGGTG